MQSKGSLFPGAVLIAAIFSIGCGNNTLSGPSTLPTTTPRQSRVVSMWNVTIRVTDISGKGCVADSLRTEINTHNEYSLAILEQDDATLAQLASAFGDYSCSFPVRTENRGFTEGPGYYSCTRERRVVNCDGTLHSLMTFGQTISGRFFGSEVSGEWSASWMDLSDDEHDVEMKAQFTGSK